MEWKQTVIASVVASMITAAVFGIAGTFTSGQLIHWLGGATESDLIEQTNFKLITKVVVKENVGETSQEYQCPTPMKVLSSHTILVPSGVSSCSTKISEDGTICYYGGCNIVAGGAQKWQTTIVCGTIAKKNN